MDFKKFLLFALLLSVFFCNAQLDSVKMSFYIEPYYSYDFSKPADHLRPAFLYSYNRANEVNVNLALAKFSYDKNRVRAHLGLMAGTYSNANLSTESGVLKNIYEAYAGVRLTRHKQLWVDAGVMPSHIGFESAIGKECWTLTRSIMADNSPYYETGVRLSYTSNNNEWYLAAFALNGWQRIEKIKGNTSTSFATHVVYKPSDKFTLSNSTYAGNDQPDSLKAIRYFNDFFIQLQVSKLLGITTGFDIGVQQKHKDSQQYNCWYAPILLTRITPADKWAVATRVEYYNDAKGVIVNTNTAHGFQTWGFSANFDYAVTPQVLWRIEGRMFSSKDDIFYTSSHMPTHNNYAVTSSLAVSF